MEPMRLGEVEIIRVVEIRCTWGATMIAPPRRPPPGADNPFCAYRVDSERPHG